MVARFFSRDGVGVVDVGFGVVGVGFVGGGGGVVVVVCFVGGGAGGCGSAYCCIVCKSWEKATRCPPCL